VYCSGTMYALCSGGFEYYSLVRILFSLAHILELHHEGPHSNLLACVLQVTVNNCKFSGFRRVLAVCSGSKGCLKDCVVDVAIQGSYGGPGIHNLAVSVLCLPA
jgi:hypothetical protein